MTNQSNTIQASENFIFTLALLDDNGEPRYTPQERIFESREAGNLYATAMNLTVIGIGRA